MLLMRLRLGDKDISLRSIENERTENTLNGGAARPPNPQRVFIGYYLGSKDLEIWKEGDKLWTDKNYLINNTNKLSDYESNSN